jgi:hypothetical protein
MDDDSTKLESGLPKTGKKKEEPDLAGVKRDESGEPLGRPISDFLWCWYKIADGEIVDEDKWLGSYSPLVACTGRRVDSREKTQYQPLTQFAEEPQRIYTIIENIIQLRLSKSPFSKWKVV